MACCSCLGPPLVVAREVLPLPAAGTVTWDAAGRGCQQQQQRRCGVPAWEGQLSQPVWEDLHGIAQGGPNEAAAAPRKASCSVRGCLLVGVLLQLLW